MSGRLGRWVRGQTPTAGAPAGRPPQASPCRGRRPGGEVKVPSTPSWEDESGGAGHLVRTPRCRGTGAWASPNQTHRESAPDTGDESAERPTPCPIGRSSQWAEHGPTIRCVAVAQGPVRSPIEGAALIRVPVSQGGVMSRGRGRDRGGGHRAGGLVHRGVAVGGGRCRRRPSHHAAPRWRPTAQASYACA